MKNYIAMIEKAGLETCKTFYLKSLVYFTEFYLELKKEGKEPDQAWLLSELKKHIG